MYRKNSIASIQGDASTLNLMSRYSTKARTISIFSRCTYPIFYLALLMICLTASPVLADLTASVTLGSGQPGTIYPGQTTQLQITLSNTNSSASITSAGFSNTLPGTLPNGLKIVGGASYSCSDSNTTGTLTANTGSQNITFSGGTIPARVGSTDGTCIIVIPVTAGTATGGTATYTYTINSGAVTGTDNTGAVANTGAVSQSINVSAIAQPSISKNFGVSTLYLGGASTTLTITLSNTNSVSIPNFSLTDNFPTNANGALIRIANATTTNTCGGSFSPAVSAGDTSLHLAGGTVPANGSCTITVNVEARQPNGVYSVSGTNTITNSNFSNDIGISADVSQASRSITVTSPLNVAKSFSHASLASGQNGTTTITLSNAATSALTITIFDDSPVDGVGNADATRGLLVNSVSNTCGGTANILQVNGVNRGVRLSGGTIPAGGSCTVMANFVATTQAANTPVTYTNTIPTGAVGVTTAGVVSPARSAAILVADTLRVTKVNNSSNPRPGNPAKYTITVQNWSSSPMSNVRVQETLPNGLTFLTGTINGNNYTPTSTCSLLTANATGDTALTFTLATIAARTGVNSPGSCSITFYAMVSTSAASSSSTANAIGSGAVCTDNGTGICNGSGDTSGNSTVNTTVLSAAKAFSPSGPLNEGTITRMTITLTNYSANTLTAVSISDTLPVSGGAQMQIANPANAASTCGSPTITATAGTTSVSMNGGTVPARASLGSGAAGTCFLQVDVVGAAGTYNNSASAAGTETYANGTTHPVTANASASIVYNSILSATKSFSPSSVSSGGRSTVTIRLANSGASALANVHVTDTLPAGMVVAPAPNAYTTCAGSISITAAPGAGSVNMTGAAISGLGNCDLLFDVVATGSANWVNIIPAGGITANGGVYNQSAVTGTLNFNSPVNLTVFKATNPSTLTFPGQVSQMTITITNGTQAVTNLRLTDYFTANGTSGAAPNGMVIAATPAASTTCPGGIVAATAGGTAVGISGVSLAAGASCAISVNVTSTTVGGITNYITAGAIITDQGLSNSGQATTSLTTGSNLGVSKGFTPNVVKPGQRSRLRITFYNPTNFPMANLAVIDTLPAGVTVPTGPNPVTTCAGATVSSPASNQVRVSGGTIAAASGGVAASCYAEIDVFVAASGDYLNTIPAGGVTATSGGSPVSNPQPTSDTLRARAPLTVHKAIANLTLDAGNPAPFTTGTATRGGGAAATMTIRLENSNTASLTGAAFTDTLPSGLVVATAPNAGTTCAGGVVIAPASATSIRLTGATVPASGSCVVTVDVLSNISGVYTNTIPAGAVTTIEGVSNEEPTRAQLIVSTPPTVSKQFSPAVIPPGGTSTLTIFLNNDNTSAVTLSSIFTDTLPTAPGAIVVAATPNVVKTCSGAVTAAAGSGTVSYASGATIPAGGCTISVNVTGATAGVHTNNIPAGALQTNLGNNQQPANATLTVSTLGYISGRVFRDNNATPNGTFETGTDAPIAGVSITLTGTDYGANGVAGGGDDTLVSFTTAADTLGNYVFAGLNPGNYTVTEPAQPAGTINGITTSGTVSGGGGGTAGTATAIGTTPSAISGIVLLRSGIQVAGSPNNNFAEVVLSGISGTVFLDENNNGLQNGADAGIAGVVIELLNGSGTVIATTTTDANGNYTFTSLQPGTYSVREPNQPANTSNGITTAGAVANGGTPGTATNPATLPSRISTVILPPNTVSGGNNFAEVPNGRRISGVVFLDYNNDGVINGSDHGIGSQTLNLTGTDINGNAVSRTATTNADGTYDFLNLPEGTYVVTQPNQPSGTTNGQTLAGTTGGTPTAVGVTPSGISAIPLTGTNTVSAGNNFAEIPGASPDLAIAKTHSPASLGASSNTGYFTLTPSNVGAVTSSGMITVTDTLPAGITPTSSTGAGWTCTIAGQIVTCTSTTVIGNGATGNPIIVRVSVGSGLSGQVLTNTATISGGGEPAGFEGNNTAADAVAIAQQASLQGHVWRDLNHDRIFNAGETPVPGWTVELLLNGVLVGSTVTAADGSYIFPNISPGTGYQVRFREPSSGAVYGYAVPNEQGLTFTNGTVSATANPAGATAMDGTLSNLTILAGANILQQSLPLDPSGIVYDAVTRNSVRGATVVISGPAGFDPATHLVGGAANASQVTSASGFYQFLLLPGAPAGTYTLSVTSPAGYMPAPSTMIPPTTGPLAFPASGVTAVQAQPAAPTGSQPTTYYFTFSRGAGSTGSIVNNHIPIDPMIGGAIVVTKTTPLVNVKKGDLVPYTITATNTLSAALTSIDIRDQLPPGFKFRQGSGTLNGVKTEPAVSGRNMTWQNLTFTPGEKKTFTLILVVGAGVSEGDYVNEAWAANNLVNSVVSNVATATVRVIPDTLFDCPDIIGKVFDDKNANGYQDNGEPGIANVRIATVRGLIITTDAQGRFHVPCPEIPNADRGSNFILKLDERTLPTGYRVTSENPLVTRITRGKMVKMNFGATVHRVVRIDVTDAAFVPNEDRLLDSWKAKIDGLKDQLLERPSIVRIAYRGGADPGDLAERRIRAVRSQIEAIWHGEKGRYTLIFEEEMVTGK